MAVRGRVRVRKRGGAAESSVARRAGTRLGFGLPGHPIRHRRRSDPLAFATARYAVSALAIAGIAAAARIPRPPVRSIGLSAVLGVPIVGLYGLLLYVGEQTTSGGLSSILIGTVPFLTTLMALPLLPGESLRRAG